MLKESFVKSTSKAKSATLPSDKEQLDKAATCMVRNSRQSLCKEPHEELFCRVFCCANAHPFHRENGEYRQLCADTLLAHYRWANRSDDPKKKGKVGDFFFTNSEPHLSEVRKKSSLAPFTYREPDICVYDKKHKLALIYDIKFPGDRWREGQLESYRKLVNDDQSKVMELNEESCKCAARNTADNAGDNTSPTAAEVGEDIQNMIESINSVLNSN